MKLQLVKGSTSQIVTVFVQDSSQTDGRGLGSLDQTSSIVGGYVRTGGTGVALAVDEDVTTEGTYQAPSAAGKVRIGTPANMTAGTYEFHFHNDLFAAGANSVFITLGGASNMAVLVIEIQLTDVDLNDGVRGGMTALPNAAANGVGGLPISATGGLDMDAIYAAVNSLDGTKILQTLNLTASGNIGIDWANVENPSTAVDLAGTDIQLCDTITTYTGNTKQTGDSFARIGAAGAGLSALATVAKQDVIDGIVDAILVDTDTTIPALIAALENLSAANVNAEVLDVINVDALVAGQTIAEALRRIGARAAGKISGAGTGTETITDWAASANTLVYTVDASGNISAITFN